MQNFPIKYKPWMDICNRAEKQFLSGLIPESLNSMNEALLWIESHAPTETILRVMTLEQIAAIYSNSGQPQAAIPWYEKSLDLFKNDSSEMIKVEYAISLSSFAKTLLKSGLLERAEATIDDACKIYAEIHGADHIFISIAKMTKVRILRKRGELSSALELAKSVLADLRTATDNPEDLFYALHEIGSIEHELSKNQDAVLTLKEGLRIGESISSPNNPQLNLEICNLRLTLAEVYISLQKYKESHGLSWRAVEEMEKILPELSPILLEAKRRLVVILQTVHKQDEAEIVVAMTNDDKLEDLNLANRRWRYLFRGKK